MALVVLLLSVALLSVVFYNDYAVQYRSELKSEALSIAHAINGGLAEEDYLRSLEQDKISPIRITWIGADGTVRYDNEAAPAQMENHAARTEVADALRYGAGESERYSATLSQKTFYYACRLQDGTVLRLAGTRDSVLGILLRMLRPAVAAVLVAIALAWLLSYRLSKRIVRPLNALDWSIRSRRRPMTSFPPCWRKFPPRTGRSPRRWTSCAAARRSSPLSRST